MDNNTGIKKFKSKKNHVFLIEHKGRPFVRKVFESEMECKREIDNYHKIEFLKPEINDFTDKYIDYEYLGDENLADLIFSLDQTSERNKEDYRLNCNLKDLLEKVDLSEQYIFHKIEKVIEVMDQAIVCKKYFISDLNLRNFIFYKNEIFLVDFEEAEIAQQDIITEFFSFLLTNKPFLSDAKLSAVKSYLAALKNYDKEKLVLETEKKIIYRCNTKNL